MNEEKTLGDVDSIDVLPKVEITGENEILISMDIDGKEIFVDIGIDEYLAKEILKKIGYGGIGWEKYNVV
ncbi:MAG: hypothetical protein A2W22_04590 [Candidatus Levybacteria bacterium RBG_16_35_11]|nr:MAG: hypothetical protein A2W22_04590 [Candidatus Levybacteria bacterium RBG_16_35_11]